MQKRIVFAALLCLFLVPSRPVLSQPYATTTVKHAPYRQPITMPFDSEQLQEKKVLVLVYSIENPRAGEAVRFLQEMAEIKNQFNFEVLGINIDADKTAAVQQFHERRGATFPLVIDKNRALAKQMQLEGDLSLYVFRKKGVLAGRVAAENIPAQKKLGPAFRAYVNRVLKLGFVPQDEPVLGDRPPAPLFEAEALDGTKIVLQQLYEKKPVVLVIFSPTCSHCRDELLFLQDLLKGDFKNKFMVLAVSRHGSILTKKFVKENGLSFPVVLDTDNAISALFESFVGVVPVAYVLDTSGRIYSRHTGFSDRMRDIYVMELRQLLGISGRPLLVPSGYSGQERCLPCHEKEHIQWSLTGHSSAFASLQRKGREEDQACVSCHVTGWNQPGGYALKKMGAAPQLEGVQCEACHGPGYQSCSAFTGLKQKKKTAGEWKALCLSCHTEKESLNFNFARRFPRILHSAAPDLSRMTRQQLVQLLQEHKPRHDLFGSPASYVGAGACKKCHEREYRHWALTPHAAAYQTKAAQAAPEDKKHRFTTGFGSAGGYPAPGRQGVQCEACHGPGERHIQEPDKKGQKYIVSLGGQCDSCVVEQICRNCHGPEDDPNFNFELSREKIRHPKQ